MGALNPRGDWVGLIEAIHAPAADDASWASAVSDSARPLFPRAMVVHAYAVEYGSERQALDIPFALPAMREPLERFSRDHGHLWIPFHFGSSVMTMRDVEKRLERDHAAEVARVRKNEGFGDAIAVFAHPRPGLVTVLSAMFERPFEISRASRALLTRVALHLEAGHRVRVNDGAVVAEIAPGDRRFGKHASRIEKARSRPLRATPEGTELWTALIEGRMSVVPRENRYLVLDNPPPSHSLRALNEREIAVLSLAARGLASKPICYALGLSPALVSTLLQSAATKIGVLSRTELVRVAALLSRDPKGLLDDDALTTAEEEVLTLLERGLDNRTIAKIRMRSVRTIANQVASLLRKTGCASRRQLVARSASRGAAEAEQDAQPALTEIERVQGQIHPEERVEAAQQHEDVDVARVVVQETQEGLHQARDLAHC
jgi:DNA-binding NarL/FixJ family response regulator